MVLTAPNGEDMAVYVYVLSDLARWNECREVEIE